MRKAYTLIELLITLAIIAILAALVFGAGGGCSVSKGTRVGTISKFAEKGVFISSHEGELVMGGVVSASKGGSAANVWRFSCLEKELWPTIEAAQLRNDVVALKYHQTFLYNPFIRSTSYLIDGLTIVTNR
jgi:prepilin-type N-terminal cleavage/methylation domain-containing protein